jgi:predicted component of type VI protein secretion system
MAKSKRKRTPESVLNLPDLEQSRSAVLNSLTSPSSQRTYDHAIREFIERYCSEPRLAFKNTVVNQQAKTVEPSIRGSYVKTSVHTISSQVQCRGDTEELLYWLGSK